MKINPQLLAIGKRTSKVVGGAVVNEFGETAGAIDDLIVTPSGSGSFPATSVGGFLGIGMKCVVVR